MDVIRDMAPPPKTGTFSSVFKKEPPSVDLKLPTDGQNITLVEICTFFPYWLKNGDVAKRFFLGEMNRNHIARIIDHHCDLDREQISPNLLTHWLNGGMRHVTGNDKWTHVGHVHTLDRRNYDSRDLTLNGAKLNCEFPNAYSSRIKVPSVLFKSLGDHVRNMPQGFDRLDVTRCVEYAMANSELNLRFPRDFGAIIEVLGKARVEPDHFDIKAAERWAPPKKNANGNQLQSTERSRKRRASRCSVVTDGGGEQSDEHNHPAPAEGSSSLSHLRTLMPAPIPAPVPAHVSLPVAASVLMPVPESTPTLVPEQIVFDLMDKGVTSRRAPLDASIENYRPSFKHLLDGPAYDEPDDNCQQQEEGYATQHDQHTDGSVVEPFARRDNRGFGDSEYGSDSVIFQSQGLNVSPVGQLLHGAYLTQDLPSWYEVTEKLDHLYAHFEPPPPVSPLLVSPPVKPAQVFPSLTSEGLDLLYTRLTSPPPVPALPAPLRILPSQHTPPQFARFLFISDIAHPRPVSDQFAHLQGHLRQDAISGSVNIHGSGRPTYRLSLEDEQFLNEFFGSL